MKTETNTYAAQYIRKRTKSIRNHIIQTHGEK